MIPAIFFYGIQHLIDYPDYKSILKCIFILTFIPLVIIALHKHWINYNSIIFTISLYFLIAIHLVGNMFTGVWFLPCLFKFLVAAAISFFICNVYIKKAPIFIPLLLIVLVMLPWKLGMWFNAEFVLSFVLGLFIKSRSVKGCKWFLIMIVPAVVFSYCWRFYSYYIEDYTFFPLILSGHGDILLYRQLADISFCLFFFALFKHFSRNYTIISQLGAKTLPIYTIHVTILGFVTHLFTICTSNVLAWLGVITVTGLLLAITLCVIYMSERNWFTNWLLCGNPDMAALKV